MPGRTAADRPEFRLLRRPTSRSPAWSPDGKGLAYSGNMKGDYEIYLVNSHGFDFDDVENPVLPLNLTDSPDRDDKSPSWRSF